jgi:hypothetical protein
LSRCNSKLRIISPKDGPAGGPDGLNCQPHSEHPKPRKRSCSIHTSVRFMAAISLHPTLSDCTTATCLPSRAKRSPFHSGVLNSCSRKLSPCPGRQMINGISERILHALIWMVGRASYISRQIDGAAGAGHSCNPTVARSLGSRRLASGEANVRYPTERACSDPVQSARSANKQSFHFAHHDG